MRSPAASRSRAQERGLGSGPGGAPLAVAACGRDASSAREAAGVVPLERCREVLGATGRCLTDAELLALRERLGWLAELAVEMAGERLAEAA